MVTTGAPRMKITYATLSADNDELQAAFDRAVTAAKEQLGQRLRRDQSCSELVVEATDIAPGKIHYRLPSS